MDTPYNLEERTEGFAREIRSFVRKIQLDLPNKEDARQLIRSSGSIKANQIEAK